MPGNTVNTRSVWLIQRISYKINHITLVIKGDQVFTLYSSQTDTVFIVILRDLHVWIYFPTLTYASRKSENP